MSTLVQQNRFPYGLEIVNKTAIMKVNQDKMKAIKFFFFIFFFHFSIQQTFLYNQKKKKNTRKTILRSCSTTTTSTALNDSIDHKKTFLTIILVSYHYLYLTIHSTRKNTRLYHET